MTEAIAPPWRKKSPPCAPASKCWFYRGDAADCRGLTRNRGHGLAGTGVGALAGKAGAVGAESVSFRSAASCPASSTRSTSICRRRRTCLCSRAGGLK